MTFSFKKETRNINNFADLIKSREDFKLKRSNEFSFIKPGTILINSPDSYDLYKFSDIAFKFRNFDYKDEDFKKTFIKLIYKMIYNPTLSIYENNKKIRDLIKFSNTENLILYYLDYLSKTAYGIKIDEDLDNSTIFNKFKNKCKKEYKNKEMPIEKIKAISKFIYNDIKYDEEWMGNALSKEIISIKEVINNKKGTCFEMSILNFLIIKNDENFKNIELKFYVGKKISGNKLKREGDTEKEIEINNNVKLKEKLMQETAKLIRDNSEKKININNKVELKEKLQENIYDSVENIDKKNVDSLGDLHVWLEFKLNENEEYVIESTAGTIIPKPFTKIEPLIGSEKYIKSKNSVVSLFIRKD